VVELHVYTGPELKDSQPSQTAHQPTGEGSVAAIRYS